jgi:ABC-2 type transport system ATP-binding protein
MIEFSELSKHYGAFRALAPLNLTVPRGEMFGFLGPNGAGKTTTIRMMMSILVPSGGHVRIAGLDCHRDAAEVKRHVGYLPDSPIFYDYLRGREILQFIGEVSEEFAVNYSMGMKKKLGLACALIHEPSVLILDEPTNGLDPRASRDVQQRLRKSADEGMTIFLSTHILEMAERLCGRIGIIHNGELAATGSPQELKEKLTSGGTLEEVFLAVTAESEGV